MFEGKLDGGMDFFSVFVFMGIDFKWLYII